MGLWGRKDLGFREVDAGYDTRSSGYNRKVWNSGLYSVPGLSSCDEFSTKKTSKSRENESNEYIMIIFAEIKTVGESQ